MTTEPEGVYVKTRDIKPYHYGGGFHDPSYDG